MNEMTNNNKLTEAQFVALGLPHLAYVKPILVEGADRFAIHRADGVMLAILEDRAQAIAAALENHLVPVSVH
ncbi:MAG TPA: DUF1150 family protein [Alphaproteobacteria bacterium]|nr:DUF1150 family protein [Alphaproteobacteria bacterium]